MTATYFAEYVIKYNMFYGIKVILAYSIWELSLIRFEVEISDFGLRTEGFLKSLKEICDTKLHKITMI